MKGKTGVIGDWADHAACKGKTDVFFAHKGDWKSARLAREICASCPVAHHCLTFAIVNDERFGVWGGVGYTERRTMKPHTKTNGPVVHPSRSSYIQGCRCEECKEAQRVYTAEYRRRKRVRGSDR